MCNAIASQLVSYDLPGLPTMCLDQALEEALGCSTVPLRLKIHVNHFAILVDGPSEIVPLAVDFHENFVDEESVTIA